MFISTRLYYQQSLNSIMFVGIPDFFQRHSPELSDSEDQYAPTRFTKFSFPKWSKKLGSLSPRLLYTSFFKRFGLLLTSSKKFITASWPWTFALHQGEQGEQPNWALVIWGLTFSFIASISKNVCYLGSRYIHMFFKYIFLLGGRAPLKTWI